MKLLALCSSQNIRSGVNRMVWISDSFNPQTRLQPFHTISRSLPLFTVICSGHSCCSNDYDSELFCWSLPWVLAKPGCWRNGAESSAGRSFLAIGKHHLETFNANVLIGYKAGHWWFPASPFCIKLGERTIHGQLALTALQTWVGLW